jgi:hypothetical protein
MAHLPRNSTEVRWLLVIVLFSSVSLLSGCHAGLLHSQPDYGGAGRMVENPVFIATGDREYLWFQIVDTVDDYFRIEREEKVRLIGDVLTEGRIDTYPMIGATILEPWRKDSTPGYEKLHATLQTIRRRASVRVIPTQGGYLIDVAVYKELEDLDRPQMGTIGSAAIRHDGTLVRGEEISAEQDVTLGWIPLGRDPTLEQRILKNILARMGSEATSALPPPGY